MCKKFWIIIAYPSHSTGGNHVPAPVKENKQNKCHDQCKYVSD